MFFVAHFLRQSSLASISAAIWFTIPGLLALRLLGWQRRFRGVLALLIAPALGICTWAPLSLAISFLRYNRAELIVAWIVVNVSAFLIATRSARRLPIDLALSAPHADPPRLRPLASILLFLGCVGFALMVVQNLLPAVRDGGLYMNEMIFDHTKIAISDAIARQGLPPKNPYYAPQGKTVLLTYYYLWHFLASQLQLLNDVPGWPADVAMTAYTSFAAAGLLVSLAIELTRRAGAGLLVLLMASVVQIADPLLRWTIPAYHDWAMPSLLVPLWLQCAWSPQHVMASCAVVLGMMIVAEIAQSPDPRDGGTARGVRPVMWGLITAAGVGSSVWVGGIALACVQPLLLLALLAARLDRRRWLAIFRSGLCAAPVALAFALPVFYPVLISNRPKHPVGFAIWEFSPHLSGPGLLSRFAQISLFWVAYLPLTLGVSVAVGLPALIARGRDESIGQRALRLMSGFSGIGFLLITQFLKAQIASNDLGWRAPIVPTMLLSVWAAAAFIELGVAAPVPPAWNPRSIFVRWRAAIMPLCWAGLTLGLYSLVVFYHTPLWRPEAREHLTARRDLLVQERAWRDVHRFSGPSDLVQANPDAFLQIDVHPGQLPGALFADRPTAYASEHCIRNFAFAFKEHDSRVVYLTMRRIFQGIPRPGDIQRLHDLNVKVVLVDREDGLWKSDALERSNLYHVALRRPQYRIYVAGRNPSTAPDR